MALKQLIKDRIRGSIPATCLAFAVDNAMANIGLMRADPEPDAHLAGKDVDADIRYCERRIAMYAKRAGVAPHGRVCEIGPGGNMGVALLLLAQGCDDADLIDRFAFPHDPNNLEAMYAALYERLPALRARFGATKPSDLPLRLHTGERAAAELFFAAHQGFDTILSCAVLEHLYDPVGALNLMANALNPGGHLMHQVDLRDHGMFTGGGLHELTFLEVPAWLYPHMTRRRGRPNRVPVARYREALERSGLKYRLTITNLVGVGEIEPAEWADIPAIERETALSQVQARRSRLDPSFHEISDADLSVAAFFLVAHRG